MLTIAHLAVAAAAITPAGGVTAPEAPAPTPAPAAAPAPLDGPSVAVSCVAGCRKGGLPRAGSKLLLTGGIAQDGSGVIFLGSTATGADNVLALARPAAGGTEVTVPDGATRGPLIISADGRRSEPTRTVVKLPVKAAAAVAGPQRPFTRFRPVPRAVRAADRIAKLPYVYGGGHSLDFRASGYDCSGSVSYVLRAAGLLSVPRTSSGLESFGEPGPGKHITIYANAGHAFMVIDGRRYDTSGMDDGTRWDERARDTAGYVVRHPAGL